MHKAAVSFASIALISGGIISCGSNADKVQLATGTVAAKSASETAAEYSKARALEAEGRTKKAAKLYGKIASEHPMCEEAPDSRLREAQIYYNSGELIDSFEMYQLFIEKFANNSKYSEAINRQAEVANAASTGQIQNSFLGLKSKIPRSKVETMFNQVRDNAPFGKTAPVAQFRLAEMWQNDNNYNKAIKAYEDLYVKYPRTSLAPEAMYRVGELLLKQSQDGNRNRGNLDTAETTFTDLTLLYPNSKQATKAKQQLKQIAQSDIRRSFDIAEFYEQKKQYKAALFYYNEVIVKTKPNSEIHSLAKQRIAALEQ
ncbi:outer membrane protein assembly factor BamD [Rubritalea sp.]|uniref:outer membrane protein assembly factor BamD n=1 Tax=Rubritalea sp. TaxID=2109375 RepID=UPI003EFA3BA5